ncbi:hypothetical protein C5167_018166 [Papaver somniferum]|uniref:Uncharacterized protein n=1 Tax=Papaver somniferum TaxID=3469 RepID=A0A4Y7IPL0_PAPSO|nr:hypothetical protein C5167_018166 [Papaver somniferum]
MDDPCSNIKKVKGTKWMTRLVGAVGCTYLDAKYPISRYFRPSIRVPISVESNAIYDEVFEERHCRLSYAYGWVDPTSNHFCAICISSQCKYTDLQHKDFGLAKGVATAIFSTAALSYHDE